MEKKMEEVWVDVSIPTETLASFPVTLIYDGDKLVDALINQTHGHLKIGEILVAKITGAELPPLKN